MCSLFFLFPFLSAFPFATVFFLPSPIAYFFLLRTGCARTRIQALRVAGGGLTTLLVTKELTLASLQV